MSRIDGHGKVVLLFVLLCCMGHSRRARKASAYAAAQQQSEAIHLIGSSESFTTDRQESGRVDAYSTATPLSKLALLLLAGSPAATFRPDLKLFHPGNVRPIVSQWNQQHTQEWWSRQRSQVSAMSMKDDSFSNGVEVPSDVDPHEEMAQQEEVSSIGSEGPEKELQPNLQIGNEDVVAKSDYGIWEQMQDKDTPSSKSSGVRTLLGTLLTMRKPQGTMGPGNTLWPQLVRHPMFASTNTVVIDFQPPRSVWKRIIPRVGAKGLLSALKLKVAGQDGSIGKDVTVDFVNPYYGALEMMSKCGFDMTDPGNQPAIDHLTLIFSTYHSIAFHAEQNPWDAQRLKQRCRARIVSSRGSIGQKWPRWHSDKVPVLLTTSLVGPGSEFIPTELESRAGLIRDAVDNVQELDSTVANQLIAPYSVEGEGFVKPREGEAVVFMGKLWQNDNVQEPVKAAVHRSPALGPLEGRVLLAVTMAPDE